MAMTRKEQLAKEQIIKVLQTTGYPTYASLLDLFHVNLTEDPNVVAYMEPGKGRIVINSGLDINQVSTVVRHEILHEYLNHHKRLLNKLAKERNLDPDNLDDLSVKEIEQSIYSNKAFNIAGDYEISNRGYTDNDKRIVRSILLNGKRLKGLVTEDDHPDWVDLSLEDMYDLLRDEMKDDPQNGSGGPDKNQEGDGSSNPSDNQGGSGSDGSEMPTIGSKGSKAIQDAEEAKREAEDVTKDIKDDGKKDELDKVIDKASDELNKEKNKLADPDKPEKNHGSTGDTSKNNNDVDINLDRINQIKKAFEDAKTQAEITREAERAIDKERIEKDRKASERYRQTPLKRFMDDMNRFIRKATAHGRGDTWKRFSRKYQDSGIIRPGSSRLANKKVPVINVYFDRSGSWDDSKIAVGMQAIGTLNNYVRKGEIKINLYYFANRVGSDPDTVGGGTEGTPIMEHIERTKPDNVIIMTDDDINDIESPVTVPGAVWLLFKGGISNNLIENIHGQTETKVYEI